MHVYWKNTAGSLCCTEVTPPAGDDEFDHFDAILEVQGELIANDEAYNEPMLALFKGGKP